MEIFSLQSLAVIGVLGFLEVLLSIDNALVLAILARDLPPEQRRRALTYGLGGAIIFRMIAIGLANYLIHYYWVKFIGGGYLLYLAYRYFFAGKASEADQAPVHGSFWKVVLLIEMTDLAFAADSILAAVALTNVYWQIVAGGLIGTIAMRFAATGLIRVLEIYPKLERSAYLMIAIVGTKVVIEGFQFSWIDFHSMHSPWTWAQWGLMALSILFGFKK